MGTPLANHRDYGDRSLSDRLGRKTMFYITMALYGVGAVGLVFSGTYYLILLFLAMMLFAAGVR